MKTPRITDFDPDAKQPVLKSPLDSMPVIQTAKDRKKQKGEATDHESDERAAPSPSREPNGSLTPPITASGAASQSTEAKKVSVSVPVPIGVPLPGRGTVPRTPKVKRLIRQRQPFDIFEDQYQQLKQIAAAEREFEDGRGMSQMVREAIDLYLKKESSSSNE